MIGARILGDYQSIQLEVAIVAALISAGMPTGTAAEMKALRLRARTILARIETVPIEEE